ncbi:MAG: P1 family peptidase [Spirochaetota bacterium]
MAKPRARDLGIEVGIFETGSHNAITDVAGVGVGHATLIQGSGPLAPGKGPVRTGATAILPHGGNLFKEKVQAGCFVLNGFGKSSGLHQIQELGTVETPIVLTNTLSVPRAAEALVAYSCAQSPEIGIRTGTVNAVVGDINDGFLNDIQGRHVKEEDVLAALEDAHAGLKAGRVPAEGNVGGGTGCSCLGFKGGIGTSSRRLPARLGGWTIGVLAQTNFGGVLSVNGAPVGRELGIFDFAEPKSQFMGSDPIPCPPGSCMVVIATDAPADSRQLTRMARRGGLGMARTGFYSASGSGDFFIAFSVAGPVPHEPAGSPILAREVLPDEALSALFAAQSEAIEEAVLNSLFAAETMTGRDGNTRFALPTDETLAILDRYGARGWGTRLPRAF